MVGEFVAEIGVSGGLFREILDWRPADWRIRAIPDVIFRAVRFDRPL
jgi:hypothetical protein